MDWRCARLCVSMCPAGRKPRREVGLEGAKNHAWSHLSSRMVGPDRRTSSVRPAGLWWQPARGRERSPRRSHGSGGKAGTSTAPTITGGSMSAPAGTTAGAGGASVAGASAGRASTSAGATAVAGQTTTGGKSSAGTGGTMAGGSTTMASTGGTSASGGTTVVIAGKTATGGVGGTGGSVTGGSSGTGLSVSHPARSGHSWLGDLMRPISIHTRVLDPMPPFFFTDWRRVGHCIGMCSVDLGVP
jgi:hypothetical protein